MQIKLLAAGIAIVAWQLFPQPVVADQSDIIAKIDSVVESLNAGEIDEDEAIEQLRDAIPRPGNYPERVVEYVVPSGAGGGSDTYARMIGYDAARIMGRSIVYNNMPGGGGQVALAYAVAQEPDGYTIYGTWAAQIIQCAVGGYQHCVATEMVPIIQNQGATEAFFVRADSPYETWDDLIAHARENPGQVRVVGAGAMGDDELNVAYINNELDLQIPYIPFDEPGQRFGALLGGHVEVLYGTIGTVLDLIQDEQIRPLLLVTPEGSPLFDEAVPGDYSVPGAADVGLDFPITRFRGMWTIPGTDPEIIAYLHNVLYASSRLTRYREYEEEAMMHMTNGYRNTEDYGAYANQIIENLTPVLEELGYTQ
jgi:putative tricarboxylic transport membrane protein